MKLNYREFGNGRPIVLLHAFPLSHQMWTEQIDPIVNDGWRIILPDFPGFGASNIDSDTSEIEVLAEGVAELLKSLNIKSCVIGGLSMGGYVTLNFSRMFPEMVDGLILADTNASSDSEEKRQGRFSLIDKIKEKGSGVLVQKMLPDLISDFTKDNNAELVNKLKSVFESVSEDAVIAALLGMAERKDHKKFLQQITVPTLLIFGEEDKVTNLDAANLLHNNIEGSKLVVIQKAGHLSNLEQPQKFNQALLEFLRKLKKDDEHRQYNY